MLTRSLKVASLLNYQAPRMMRGFATAKKDYYEILGLNADASVDEIKTAYRNLAKRFHPDVNAGGEAYQGDAEKFRDVVEAYQVLSVQESRTAYDLKNQSAPDFIYRAQRMEAERKYNARGKDGNPIQEPYPSGSYAEQKREFLANERKKFNVNEFGRYNGGVPRKGRGTTRGSSMGSPGAYHDPFLHNLKINPNPDSQFVTSADALAFKNYMMEDRYSLKRKGTWFQAYVDFDYFKLNTYRYGWRWIRNVFLIVFGMTGVYDILNRTRNRHVLDQISALGKEANLQAGVKLSDGRVVKQGSTGIVKIV